MIESVASFEDALRYCDDTIGTWKTQLAYFKVAEPGLDQRWLSTYKPWVNIRKTNQGWISPNGQGKTGNLKVYDAKNFSEEFVLEQKTSHKCAVYNQVFFT